MRCLLTGAAVAVTFAIIDPALAQVPVPGQPRPPPSAYSSPDSYRLNALTPEDAYRQRLITRWELERLTGPTPQALQGPSPNGDNFDPGN